MRAVIVVLAVMLGLGIWATSLPDSPVPSAAGRAPAGGEGRRDGARSDRNGPRVVPLESVRSAAPPVAGPQASATGVVAVPAPLPPSPAQQLPPTLELVSLPTLPGAKAAPTRSISREAAIASVITSREFQDTVTPLARLYLATFGRYPDYEGLNYYTGQREEARPLHEIAAEFVGSREFALRYGSVDDAQFVELLFNNVLGTPTQADVRGYWVEALESGRMTRGEVLVDLAESGAFRERSAHQVFVSTAYTEILRRTPDPVGYAYWLGQLRAGQPRDTIINGLLSGR